MSRQLKTGLMAAALLLLGNSLFATDETPEWKWEPGTQRAYTLSISRRQTSGDSRLFKTLFNLDLAFRIECLARKTGAMKFTRVRIETQAGKTAFSYDSESQEEQKETPWSIAADSLLASAMPLDLNSRGISTDFSEYDANLKAGISRLETVDSRTAFLAENHLGAHALVRIIESSFNILPSESGGDAEEWSTEDTLRLGMGMELLRKTDYSIIDREESNRTLTIEAEGTLAALSDEAIELPGGNVDIGIVDSAIGGTTDFSTMSGCIVKQDTEGVLELEMKISDPARNSEPSELRSRLEQKSVLRLIDEGDIE